MYVCMQRTAFLCFFVIVKQYSTKLNVVRFGFGTKLDIDYIEYKKRKNYVTYIINQAKQEFYRNFIDENSNDPRRLL